MRFFDESFLTCELTRRIERIGVHTAAHGSRHAQSSFGTILDYGTGEIRTFYQSGEPQFFDTRPEQVHNWHKQRRWAGAGYSELYGLKGQIYSLRDPNVTPAAVKGFNRRALHVCCSGHHNYHDWSAPQLKVLIWRCAYNVVRSGLYEKYLLNNSRLLGHNEFWTHRLVPSIIRKTCPGTEVSMRNLRISVQSQLRGWEIEHGWRPNHAAFGPADWRVLDERPQGI